MFTSWPQKLQDHNYFIWLWQQSCWNIQRTDPCKCTGVSTGVFFFFCSNKRVVNKPEHRSPDCLNFMKKITTATRWQFAADIDCCPTMLTKWLVFEDHSVNTLLIFNCEKKCQWQLVRKDASGCASDMQAFTCQYRCFNTCYIHICNYGSVILVADRCYIYALNGWKQMKHVGGIVRLGLNAFFEFVKGCVLPKTGC